MRKIIITYGLVGGGIIAALVFFSMLLYHVGWLDLNNGEIYGYTSMVAALSMVFFGIRACRDKHFNGIITFGQAFRVGFLIAVIATVMYAVAWEICFHTVAADFVDKMIDHYREELVKSGASPVEVEAAMAKMESYKEWYQNPLIRFFVTMMEMFWVGVVVALVSAGLLRTRARQEGVA